MEVARVGGGTLFPQPGANSRAPGRPVFVDAEFLGHGVTCFGEGGSGPFVPDLGQRGQISANGEDDGSGAWEAGKSVVLGAQIGS